MMEAMDHPVVLFDGVCNFCNASVNFIIARDPQKRIRFAPLQSEAGQKFLKKFNLSTTDFETMILVEGNRCYKKSTAALRVAKRLDGFWPLLFGLVMIPPFIRNGVYDLIAQNRHRLLGKTDTCPFPTPELKDRFLE